MMKLTVAWVAAQLTFFSYSLAFQPRLQPQPQQPLFKATEHLASNAYDVDDNPGWKFRWQRGAITGWLDNEAAEANFTGSMGQFMMNNTITQAQLSIARNGNQLANYGFNYNDPNSFDVQVDDHFLLASISKIYCVAAIRTLFERGLLLPWDPVYTRLRYTKEYANDSRVFNITVQNLLEHLGGDNTGHLGGDPAYSMRQIALDMSNGSHPATEREIIEWKLKKPLDFTPGNATYCEDTNGVDFCYSNYGFILLSYLVENVTGAPDYYTWLNDNVLQPGGFNVTKWLTDPDAHSNDVIKQIDFNYGPSALNPLQLDWVPSIYGGDGMYKDSDMGGAALATSAATLTKTLAKYPVVGWQEARAPGGWRTGSTPGAFAYTTQRPDGLDVAMVFNTRTFDTDTVANVLYAQLDQFITANVSKSGA